MTFVRYYPRTFRETRNARSWTPAADVIEHEHGYELNIDLPGFSKSDVTITIDDGVLTLTGARAHAEPEKDNLFRSYERPWGSFTRSFRLPDEVDPDQVNATYENGVLKLELTKREEAKPRMITVS